MRVAHFASLGALAAAAGLATAQPPESLPQATNPLANPAFVEQPPAPPPTAPAAPPAPTPATPMPPAAPPPTPPTPGTPTPGTPPPAPIPTPIPTPTPPAVPTPTPLPAPTPMNPTPTPPPGPAAAPVAHQTPVAAWSGMQAMNPGGVFAELAQAYNAPMHGPQTWGGVEYLLWFVKPTPMPVPLVNTTIVPEDLANSVASGGITDPLARTIFGGQSVNFSTANGIRVVGGAWLDSCQETGFEVNMFYIPELSRSVSYTGGTAGNGGPALTVPFNAVGGGVVNGETSTTIAGPFAGFAVVGTITEQSTIEFWGGDADLLLNLWKGEFWRLDAIGGFKYVDLNEDMTFITTVRTAPFGSTQDQFQTTNHFYGGEVGARFTGQIDRWGLVLSGKLGLGDNSQTVDIRGASIVPTNFGGGFAPGGLFAQSSNIGKTSQNDFSVVPQFNGTVTFDVNTHVKAYVGYNYIYMSNVVRPGNQIDRNINPDLAPVFGGSATGAGVAQPARTNQTTDFLAHGVNFGLSFNW